METWSSRLGVGRGANDPTPENHPVKKAKGKFCRTDLTERPGNEKKDFDYWFGSWNVLSLNRPGALRRVCEEVQKYRVKITALQEVRWKGSNILDTKTHTIFWSGGRKNVAGTAFLVEKRCKQLILDFSPVNERICTLRVKFHKFNVSLLCAYAPTEDADDEDKASFYELLERTYDKLPRYDVKILLGDLNAKIGKEHVFRPVIGGESAHEESNDNGTRLIDFACSKGMCISSTFFPHKNIHKVTWRSADGVTENQIDHVLIDNRHSSDIADVRSYRGADGDSDHYLVRIKYKQRIKVNRVKSSKKTPKFAIQKLKNDETRQLYVEKLEKVWNDVEENESEQSIDEKWDRIRTGITNTAEEVLGYSDRVTRTEWYDQDCAVCVEDRNTARLKMLDRRTRANEADYIKKRKLARRMCRRRKREWEKARLEEIENLKNTGQIRQMYIKLKEIKGGFQPRTTFCRDKEGNLIGGKEEILMRWANYFEELLRDESNPGVLNGEQMDQPHAYTYLTEAERVPELWEVEMALKKMKNNKAPGGDRIPAELLKNGGQILLNKMHGFITDVWEDEIMPTEWKYAVICPIHKKNDKSICSNYRGISLLAVMYKVFAKVLAGRLMPFIEDSLREYQCGFRPGRSTTDQIFTVRNIMEKCHEFNISLHHLFVDFKQAYDSINRDKLFDVMEEFQIPPKLINLVKMTLKGTKCRVQIQGDLSPEFGVNRGLRQGDQLSTMLFNLCLEKIMRNVVINRGGSIMNRSLQFLAYADDVDCIGRTVRSLGEGYEQMREEALNLGLQVNVSKTKYLIATRDGRTFGNQQDLTLGEETFERVEHFTYLGSIISGNNDITIEITNRLIAANKAYWSIQTLLKSKLISLKSKFLLYKVFLKPVLLYGCESWTLVKKDQERLLIWERKVLRKIFGPVNENGNWRIRTNRELMERYREIDIVTDIKIRRLSWLGHMQRMKDDRIVKKVFISKPGGSRPRGRPRRRWLDDVEDDLQKLKIKNWRSKAQNREEWRAILRQARVLDGLLSQ